MSRELWGSRSGFILAAIGSAIGLGNIWRFPYQAYDNGGGAFLIPYFIAMLVAGIPFMILEFTLGHKYRCSTPKIYATANRRFGWLGWFQTLLAAVLGIYYIAIIAWALSYFGFSFTQQWGANTNDFFFHDFLNIKSQTSPLNIGSVQWLIVIPLAMGWGVSLLATLYGVKKGLERINKILMPLLFLMMILLLIRVLTLPGSLDGINWLFKPDFSKLSDPKVWTGAFGQIFFSLSIGMTIMMTYSSYLPKKSDINNSACITVLCNCGFSLLAGVLIFGALGFMAHTQDKALTDVVSSGIGLAFVTLPEVINQMPAASLIGPLFFLTLIVAGISSHVSITEAVVSGIGERFGWSRKTSVFTYCGIGFVLSLAFTTQGGLPLLDLVDHFFNNIALLGGALLELILFGWAIKIIELREHANRVSDIKIGYWWDFCIQYLTLIIMGILFVTNFVDELKVNYGGYSNHALLIFGWGLIIALIILSLILSQKATQVSTQEDIA